MSSHDHDVLWVEYWAVQMALATDEKRLQFCTEQFELACRCEECDR